MKATICVFGPRIETYSDAMAAILKKYPQINEFDIANMTAEDNQILMDKIDNDLDSLKNEDSYKNVKRCLRTCRSIKKIDQKTFGGSKIIDVSGVQKEKSFDILAISIITGARVGNVSFQEFRKDFRQIIGVHDYVYMDSMETPVLAEIHKWRRRTRFSLYFFVFILFIFLIVALLQYYGAIAVDDKLLNLFGFLLGVGGVVQAVLATDKLPHWTKIDL